MRKSGTKDEANKGLETKGRETSWLGSLNSGAGIKGRSEVGKATVTDNYEENIMLLILQRIH